MVLAFLADLQEFELSQPSRSCDANVYVALGNALPSLTGLRRLRDFNVYEAGVAGSTALNARVLHTTRILSTFSLEAAEVLWPRLAGITSLTVHGLADSKSTMAPHLSHLTSLEHVVLS